MSQRHPPQLVTDALQKDKVGAKLEKDEVALALGQDLPHRLESPVLERSAVRGRVW